MAIRVKRVYEDFDAKDGKRYLVDRVWPRGISKADLPIEAWLKDLGPSDSLRRWFGHDPNKWPEFKRRYFAELREKEAQWRSLLAEARKETVTLLFGARDDKHNQAVALREFLNRRQSSGRVRKK